MIKYILTVVLAALLFVGHSAANAAFLTFNLDNVVFTDGAIATGSFDFDPTTLDFGDFNIATTDGSGDDTFGYTYNTVNSVALGDQSAFVFGSNDITGNVLFLFTNDDVTGPGTYGLTLGDSESGEVAPINVRFLQSGDITTNAVSNAPEPSGLVTMYEAFTVMLAIGLLRKARIANTKI